jgi:hypothetical protein
MARHTRTIPIQQPAPVPRWSPATRVAFRFCLVYFGLYALVTQIAGGIFLFPGGSLPALGTVWPLRDFTLWCAEHIFGAVPPLLYTGNSGDTLFHWVQTAWMLTGAIVAATIWSAVDAARDQYVTLYKWFRLFIRFGLAAQMFYYGMAKIIPTQFPPPALVTLVQPVGSSSPSDLLWTFMGASTAYEIFTGCAELAAGLLLLAPRTTLLGALIALIDMIQVFVLNMAYDFGLKQISFHLMLMAVFLLAPDLRRLGDVLVFDRPAPPSTQPPLFATGRANRIALIVQVAFGLYLVGMFAALSVRYWYGPGGPGSPRSPLYGIWEVEELTIDGETRPAVLNDYDRRWRRVILDLPSILIVQRTDDSLAHYGVSVDTGGRTLALTKGNSRIWSSRFAYDRPSDDRLILDGEMDSHRIRAKLRLVQLDTFRLLNSPFRWIRPPDPYAG